MPELPGVEMFRTYIAETSLHKVINSVQIKEPGLLYGISKRALERKIIGRQIYSIRRHGKYLLGGIGHDEWLVLHFGMTGFLKYFKNIDREPKDTRMLIRFDNGYNLAYVCIRKLGLISLTDDVSSFIEKKKLGPDAISLKLNDFENIMTKKRGTIKGALMNQRNIAGIGNIYSDEILFQSKYDPRNDVRRLDTPDLKKIFTEMKNVLKTAIDSKANPDKMPRTYLVGNRKAGKKCPLCKKGEIKKATISGRSSYYCPKHQRKI